MIKITQTMFYHQSLILYAKKHGVTKAAIHYLMNRKYIYRWLKRYDGSLHSLADKSDKPHHHPNQHTEQKLTLIHNMRRSNPNNDLIVLWVKLRQLGYIRSISGLYHVLIRSGQMAVKLPNPKYIQKPYEQMKYPSQRVQIEVKFVQLGCLVDGAKGKKFYQYTAIDEYSRYLYLKVFEEHITYSSTMFLKHLVKAFSYAIKCVQTDNGF